MSRDRGELAIVLHAHMPYVEGFGTWPFGEEWLLEAIATVYVPLVGLCERWAENDERAVLTLNVSPVLADQLVLPEVRDRCLAFVREIYRLLGDREFSWRDVLALVNAHPELLRMNEFVRQKSAHDL